MSEPDLDELPSLLEWGDELREATDRMEQERRRRRRRMPVRRLGVALAAMFLLVPGAVATRSIWNDPITQVDPSRPSASTSDVRLVEGHTAGVRWRVGGFDAAGGRRCLQMDTYKGAGHSSGRGCSLPLSRARISFGAVNQHGLGFVFGTVAPDVRSVEVAVPGGRRVRVATTAVAPDVLRRSRMRGPFRMFVATFTRGFDPSLPPTIAAYDGSGATLGQLDRRRR